MEISQKAEGEMRKIARAYDLPEINYLLAEHIDHKRREADRLRDLEYPEFTPEAVTDAAYETIADFYTPGVSDPVQTVLIPKLVETIADAVYRAARSELHGTA